MRVPTASQRPAPSRRIIFPKLALAKTCWHRQVTRPFSANPNALMSTELMTELLEAGVHFGHQTKRWNPKMKPFIFEKRNAIYIIDLGKTVGQLDVATEFLRKTAERGGKVLFVGCKKQ